MSGIPPQIKCGNKTKQNEQKTSTIKENYTPLNYRLFTISRITVSVN